MIGKNLLTVLIVVAVLGAALFGYHYFKKSKDLQSHHEDSYMRLVEASKKSPRAGLAQMGRAINQYYDENKSYPTNLDQLYPKYMNSQAFIKEIKWTYRPTGNNFRLSKSMGLEDRTVVASIDKSLHVRMGARTTVALVDRKPSAAPVTAKPDRTKDRKKATAPDAFPKDISTTSQPPKVKEPVRQSETKEPEKEDVVTYESETEMDVIASNFSGRFLVWKNRDGTVGFGNVQYPEADDIDLISIDGVWYKFTR